MAAVKLSSSRRVVLKKEVATRLGFEDWALIDVTLREFGLSTTDEWSSGDRVGYVLSRMEKIKDQALIELAQHVGIDFAEGTPPRVDPPFWRKGMFRIFVSHLAAHKALAESLQASLLPYGISSFVAHSDITPTTEWIVQIETALATCEVLIALMHEGFHESFWTDQEVGFAMGRGVPIFAVHFGEAPYGFVGRFQAFAGKRKSAPALALELFDTCRRHKQTQKRMSDVLVGLFEESVTFAQAKERIGYLEELEVWDSSFNARLQSAVKSNSQIQDSWGVPKRVSALIKKHT
jgi:hypothetical protein